MAKNTLIPAVIASFLATANPVFAEESIAPQNDGPDVQTFSHSIDFSKIRVGATLGVDVVLPDDLERLNGWTIIDIRDGVPRALEPYPLEIWERYDAALKVIQGTMNELKAEFGEKTLEQLSDSISKHRPPEERMGEIEAADRHMSVLKKEGHTLAEFWTKEDLEIMSNLINKDVLSTERAFSSDPSYCMWSQEYSDAEEYERDAINIKTGEQFLGAVRTWPTDMNRNSYCSFIALQDLPELKIPPIYTVQDEDTFNEIVAEAGMQLDGP